MSSKIRVLNDQTINQIAAGEVIENPASVVKELVENSLDAGSSEIYVEIKGGGRQLIRISDNGCGMNSDDAVLCLERHATSKIRQVDDIQDVITMGFRGEAIPSIASISKFTLITSENEDKGTLVIVDGGKILKCTKAARDKGTTIEVKSLFFNVPVRRKFQKSPVYDTNEILRVVTLLSLANPKVKFQLISNHKTVLTTNISTEKPLQERITQVLGGNFCTGTCSVDHDYEQYKIEGVVGMPHIHRHNRTGQYLFINKRAIFSPLVSYIVRESYGTMLPTNRHPIFVLHITMPGPMVDVNVHPQKREVRLRQEESLKTLVKEGIKQALQGTQIPVDEGELPELPSFSPKLKENYFMTPLPTVPEEEVTYTPKQQEFFEEATPPPPKILGTINRFIMVDATSLGEKDGIYLVDQRTAHSRIVFERLTKERNCESQTLLIPYTLDLPPTEAALIKDHMETLNKMGIQIQEIGPKSFSINAIPELFGSTDPGNLLNHLIEKMGQYQDKEVLKKEIEKITALAASRASISNKLKITMEEALSLVKQLLKCENPYHCPLGKTTMLKISEDEIIKKFQKGEL